VPGPPVPFRTAKNTSVWVWVTATEGATAEVIASSSATEEEERATEEEEPSVLAQRLLPPEVYAEDPTTPPQPWTTTTECGETERPATGWKTFSDTVNAFCE
jgi:hypothetical protein